MMKWRKRWEKVEKKAKGNVQTGEENSLSPLHLGIGKVHKHPETKHMGGPIAVQHCKTSLTWGSFVDVIISFENVLQNHLLSRQRTRNNPTEITKQKLKLQNKNYKIIIPKLKQKIKLKKIKRKIKLKN